MTLILFTLLILGQRLDKDKKHKMPLLMDLKHRLWKLPTGQWDRKMPSATCLIQDLCNRQSRYHHIPPRLYPSSRTSSSEHQQRRVSLCLAGQTHNLMPLSRSGARKVSTTSDSDQICLQSESTNLKNNSFKQHLKVRKTLVPRSSRPDSRRSSRWLYMHRTTVWQRE